MHKYITLLVIFAICSHTMSFDISRVLNVEKEEKSSGVAYSQFDSASKSRAKLVESMTDAAGKIVGKGATEADENEDASRSADANEGGSADADAASAGGDANEASSRGAEANAGASAAGEPNPDDALNGKDNKTCIERKETIDVAKVVALFLSANKGYGVFSTKENYNELSLLVRGAPLNGSEEINQLCLMGQCTAEEHTLTGFATSANPDGYKSVFNCQLDKSGLDSTCKPNPEKSSPPMDSKAAISVSKASLVWTDNEKYLVIATCFSDGKKAWFTVSTEKDIDDKTQATVLEKVKDVGLDVTDPHKLNYDQCKV